ncbi:MAG: DUF5112 domain-containing protein [Prevotella sp.]|nr:DUF5112 domain-containing protein [Prevotella sp.]
MWLRHALKLLPLLLLSACSSPDRQAVDKLNALSYACHYRSLDSTEHYAQAALSASSSYADGHAEALNNLAFVRIAQMRYGEARQLLDRIPSVTDNQLELLVGYIQQMRLCQRESQNRAFYDRREQALRALRRIGEERAELTSRQQQRLVYAQSELAIVTSTYYYYVGLDRKAADALFSMPDELETDTAQYLNYLYNVGSGGMITSGTQESINQVEFDHLMRCYLLARQAGITYFAANSLEALAEHLMVDEYRDRLMADNLPAFKYFNPEGVDADSLALWLAGRSLDLFSDFGDVYQIAGAHRTLASCYLSDDHYEEALHHLQLSLQDTIINQAPDLVASIREQLSVAYAAIDDKANSDLNRNVYLDLQEQTRQDRSLEARAGQLEQSAVQLNVLIGAVVAAIVVLVLLLMLFFLRIRRHGRSVGQAASALSQQEDELKEQLAMARLRVEKGERLALEQRAKISLVNGITPLIDRIIHEVGHLDSPESQEYISELTDNINEQNDVLTHWIQLRQGELSLHIETFPLQQLFDIVGKSRRGFTIRNITLDVVPTEARVKADRVLTLFMLNTLADNARKFTPDGGHVSIAAEETADYVEISVSDTGIGMTPEQLAHVFDRKVVVDDAHLSAQDSHGFGLLNCRGIVEKYRKMSKIFSVCQLAAESRVGEGSRFFFRLPRGVARLLLPLFLSLSAQAQSHDALSRASAFADSAYFSNVRGDFLQTLAFVDSSRVCLNAFYRQQRPAATDTLLRMGDPSVTPPEILWLRDSLKINYSILLAIRNESAVAALALHQWQLYQYNNRIYTQLFKELSADTTLDDYCRKMQQSQTNKQVAIILLVFLLVAILLAVVWQVLVSLGRAARRQQEQQDRLELTRDELARAEQEEAALHVSNAVLDNCLSTLKHETMYYPSRIRQLLDAGDTSALPEVVAYYRELYGILSRQAMRQTDRMRLHLRPLDHDILGDPVLIGYLFELLRKQAATKTLDVDYRPKDDKYVVCTVRMPALQLTPQQAQNLFFPAADHIPYLLCRQIVRDHGEATNRRGCAIRAEQSSSGVTQIVITLPRSPNP